MTDRTAPEEPAIQPAPSPVEGRLNLGLGRIAGLLTSIVGALLVVFVLLALASAVAATVRPLLHGDLAGASTDGLDAAFLVVILLELVYTTLSRGPVAQQVQEFLVVGITSGVRKGLEVGVQRAGDSQTIVINLAINAFGVLVLVAALWLIRQRLHSERDRQ